RLGRPRQIGDRLDAMAAHLVVIAAQPLRLVAARAGKGATRAEVAARIGRAKVGQVALYGCETAGMRTIRPGQRRQQALGGGVARAMQHVAWCRDGARDAAPRVSSPTRPGARHRAPTPYRTAGRRCRGYGWRAAWRGWG